MSKPVQPITISVKIGALLFAAGLAAWVFLGDWRFGVVGLLLLVVSGVVGAPTRRGTS